LPHLSPIVADMIRLQRLTGCRPEDVCHLRPCDVDTSGDVWLYRPGSHKTEHRDRDRVIAIGPRAQEVLRPYLLRDKQSFCFVPAESEQKRNATRRENRVSPMTPSQAKRCPKRRRGRPPGACYSTDSYRRAITRGCELANRGKPPSEQIPEWSPNQLRHTTATEIRRAFGLEAAQVALGHAAADVTQIYAEKNLALASEVMRKIG
jgi:integrase